MNTFLTGANFCYFFDISIQTFSGQDNFTWLGERSRIRYELKSEENLVVTDKFICYKVSEEEISLMWANVSVAAFDKYGAYFNTVDGEYGEPICSFNRATKKFTGVELDNLQKVVCSSINYHIFKMFCCEILKDENSYAYVLMNNSFISEHKYTAINLLKCVELGVLEKIESIGKNMGLDFINSELAKKEFSIVNAKKLHQVVELPPQVITFLNESNLSTKIYTSMKVICAEDRNEGLYVVDWYNAWNSLKNIRTNISSEFDKFINIIADIKSIRDISVFKLIPYLVGQQLWSEAYDTDKLIVPTEFARSYRDYINLGGFEMERFPSSLKTAHNILTRNVKCLDDPETLEMFDNVIGEFKDYEFSKGNYSVVAPTEANDLVEEGKVLKHCVGTYVKLIANKCERVMFVRESSKKDMPLYTLAFDKNFDITQFRQSMDEEVEDSDAIEFVKEWRTKMKKGFGATKW